MGKLRSNNYRCWSVVFAAVEKGTNSIGAGTFLNLGFGVRSFEIEALGFGLRFIAFCFQLIATTH